MPRNTNKTLDTLLILKDAVAVTASGAAQVGGTNKIVDLGAGRVDGIVMVDVTAIDVADGNEAYSVVLQGSTTSDFSAGNQPLGCLMMGDSTVANNLRDVDSVIGRFEVHFTNEQNGTIYRYVRLYTLAAGTTPSITHSAFIAKK
jgi:hypothetical protein